VRGPGQAQVLAQGAALVFGAEQAAPAQLGQHQLDEVGQAVRQGRPHHVEAVGRAAAEPVFELVGHLGGRAHQGPVAARRDHFQELAQARFSRRAMALNSSWRLCQPSVRGSSGSGPSSG
jgi:hypothetical protein